MLEIKVSTTGGGVTYYGRWSNEGKNNHFHHPVTTGDVVLYILPISTGFTEVRKSA